MCNPYVYSKLPCDTRIDSHFEYGTRVGYRRIADLPAQRGYSHGMKENDEAIYATLSRLLLTGALPAGTQLIETRVAAIFGVSRERVRKVLHRLGHERLLEQARGIHEARRITEGGIVAWLATRRMPQAQADALDRHLQAEEVAAGKDDRAESIRLSGEFHLLLAEVPGSQEVVSNLRELVSRTSMLVALYEGEQCIALRLRGAPRDLPPVGARRFAGRDQRHAYPLRPGARTECSKACMCWRERARRSCEIRWACCPQWRRPSTGHIRAAPSA